MDINPENQSKAAILAEELHVTEELAQMAVVESNGELAAAREIIRKMLPQYLVIKARFVSPKPTGGSGLILVVVKKKVKKFLLFRTVYDDDRSWAENIKVHQPVDSFLKIIRDYFVRNNASSRVFDAEKLRKGLKPLQDVAALQYLFDLWDRPKVEVIGDMDPAKTYDDPGTILTNLFQKTLSDALLDSVNVDLDYDFYTESQFETISTVLGLKLKMKTGMGSSEDDEIPDTDGLQVYLKGQFVMDAANGVPVQSLEVGDSVYVEMTDKTAMAITVGRVVGAYKRGLWLPIRGRITEIKETPSERKLFTVKVAKSVHINVLTIDDIKVRTFGMSVEDRLLNAESSSSDTSMVPLLIGVGLLAFQIIILLLLR